MDYAEAVICARVIATLVVADDDVTEAEHHYLQQVIESMGLSERDRTLAMTVLDGRELEEAVASLTPELQEGLLEALVTAAMTDGEFHADEKAFVNKVALAMGLTTKHIEKAWMRALASS